MFKITWLEHNGYYDSAGHYDSPLYTSPLYNGTEEEVLEYARSINEWIEYGIEKNLI